MSKAQKLVDIAKAKLKDAEPIARLGRMKVKSNAKAFGKGIKEMPFHNKVGLGLGVTGLSVSVAGYKNSRANSKSQAQHAELQEKSLQALEKIHQALAEKKPE